MNILILGPPGSGKGSQSSLLSHSYHLSVISTGDLLRSISLDSSDLLGKKINEVMSSGDLVDDDLMCQVFYERLKKEKRGFILDGFPRNLFQAKFLSKTLSEINKSLDIVIELSISFELVSERIRGRLICGDCGLVYNFLSRTDGESSSRFCSSCGSTSFVRRCDDLNLEVVRKRFDKYFLDILYLRDFYRDILFLVSAEDEILKVNSIIKNKLDGLIIS